MGKSFNDEGQQEFNIDYLDKKELASLDILARRYERLIMPGPLEQAGKFIGEAIPQEIKDNLSNIGASITEQKFYKSAMSFIAEGFKSLEVQAARVTLNQQQVIDRINKVTNSDNVTSFDEICKVRSYELAKISGRERLPNLALATAEGATTGVIGFVGVVPNIVTSTFVYYRAVQSVAMIYGYNVQEDPDELVIASEVFSMALAPNGSNVDGIAGSIGKIMMLSEATLVRQLAKQGWGKMADHVGVPLFIAQIRALAHKAAKKALEEAGKEGLENVMFRGVLKQLGKRLALKTVQRAVPVISAAIGGFFDAGQMAKILDFADLFYQKRFILEKGERIEWLNNDKKDAAKEPVD